jgi:hypothetical protein
MVLNHPRMLVNSRKGKNKHKKNKFKDQSLGERKEKISTRRMVLNLSSARCGGANHIVKKCKIPHHLVHLYQKSLKEAGKAK